MGTSDCENNWNQHCHWTPCIKKSQPQLHGHPGWAALCCSDLQKNLPLEAWSPLSWDFFKICFGLNNWALVSSSHNKYCGCLISAHVCHLVSWKWDLQMENSVRNGWEVKLPISSCRVQNINEGSNYSKTKPYKPTKVIGKAILKKKNNQNEIAWFWQNSAWLRSRGGVRPPMAQGLKLLPARLSRQSTQLMCSHAPNQEHKKGGVAPILSEIFLLVHSIGWNFQATSIPLHWTAPGTSLSAPHPLYHRIFSTDLGTFWIVPSSSLPHSFWVGFRSTMGQGLLPAPASMWPPCFGD